MRQKILLWTAAIAFCCGNVNGQEIDKITAAWSKAYSDFGTGGSYHYRCTCNVTFPAGELPKEHFGHFTSVPLTSSEVYRLGSSVRGDFVWGDDLSVVREKGFSMVFHQDAAYQIQNGAYMVLPPVRTIEDRLSQGLPYFDPLSDALGLGMLTSAWRIGDGSTHPYNVAESLQTGRYEISAHDGDAVTLTADGADEMVLDSTRDYTVLQRRWNWNIGKPLKCVVVNEQWSQFPAGTWYPQATTFQYYPASGGDNAEPFLIAKLSIEALPPPTKADFEFVADQPGWTIYNHCNLDGINNPLHTLKEGESIRLADVASGKFVRNPTWIERSWQRLRRIAGFRGRGATAGTEQSSVDATRIVVWISVALIVAAAAFEFWRRKKAKTAN